MDGQEISAGQVFISYRHEDSASGDRLESKLVDAAVMLINREVNYQNNGFPNITKLGKILASVQVTAK